MGTTVQQVSPIVRARAPQHPAVARLYGARAERMATERAALDAQICDATVARDAAARVDREIVGRVQAAWARVVTATVAQVNRGAAARAMARQGFRVGGALLWAVSLVRATNHLSWLFILTGLVAVVFGTWWAKRQWYALQDAPEGLQGWDAASRASEILLWVALLLAPQWSTAWVAVPALALGAVAAGGWVAWHTMQHTPTVTVQDLPCPALVLEQPQSQQGATHDDPVLSFGWTGTLRGSRTGRFEIPLSTARARRQVPAATLRVFGASVERDRGILVSLAPNFKSPVLYYSVVMGVVDAPDLPLDPPWDRTRRALHHTVPREATTWAHLAQWDATATERHQQALAVLAQQRQQIVQREQALQQQASVWDGLFLPERTLDALLRSLVMVLDRDPAAPTGTLLYGPPGTGKTEIARRLARAAGVPFLSASASTLKSGHVGGTEEQVAALWKDARAKAPCVLFIDECDSCFPDRGSATADAFAKSITEGFLAQWQGLSSSAGIWVLGATNHRELVDPAIQSRFTDLIEVPPPDATARAGILATTFADLQLAGPVPTTLVAETAGLSGRDLTQVVRNLKRAVYAPGEAPVPLTPTVVQQVLRDVRGRGATSVDARATWDTLVLSPTTQQQLRQWARMLQQVDLVRAHGLAIPRGALLYGPPGTGKTQIARTLANEAGLTFLAVTPSQMKGTHVGQTAPLVRQLFERARAQAPAILFLDELDAVAPVRGQGDSFTDELVAELLQQMDGAARDDRVVFVLAATNRPDQIDPAVRSRLATAIAIPLPDLAQRQRLLQQFVVGQPVQLRDASAWTRLAAATEGWAGRDLRMLVDAAGARAFARADAAGTVAQMVITDDDFRAALQQPSA